MAASSAHVFDVTPEFFEGDGMSEYMEKNHGAIMIYQFEDRRDADWEVFDRVFRRLAYLFSKEEQREFFGI